MGPPILPGATCRTEGYSTVPSPFSMDDVTFRGLGHRLVDTLAAYLDELPQEPVYRPLPAEVRQELEKMDIPAEGVAPEDVIESFLRLVLPYGRGQNHPCFAAFVDPAAAKLSMLAAFASAVTNTSGAGGNYAAIYVERAVIRWLMEIIGFPQDGSDGVLLGGGSDANRHCLEVARYWGAQVNGWDIRAEGLHGHPRLTMYMSAEGHSCLEKAAFTLGLGAPRKVMAGEDFRMDLADLRAAVAADRQAGHRPFLVAANAGSVKTGAIDPLGDLADFCQRGGPLAARGRRLRRPRGTRPPPGATGTRAWSAPTRSPSTRTSGWRWPSAAVAPSCGRARCCRTPTSSSPPISASRRDRDSPAMSGTPIAAPSRPGIPGGRSRPSGTSSRPGRPGSWITSSAHVDLARYLEEVIEASPELELLAAGPLTAVCFRYVPAGLRDDDQSLDLLNQAIMEDLQVGGRAFLAGTDIRGRFALRSCALHYALDEGHVQAIVDAVRDAGHRRIRAGAPQQAGDEMTAPMPRRSRVKEDVKCAS